MVSSKQKSEKNEILRSNMHFYLVRYNLFIICKLITNKKETRKPFSALCRACLSCRISCSTAPGVTCTSSACRLHVICASSACHLHIIHMSSVHVRVICTCAYVVHTRTRHPHIVCRPSAPLLMVTMGLNYLLL